MELDKDYLFSGEVDLYGGESLFTIVNHIACKYPGKTAIEYDGGRLTYRELINRVNFFANSLYAKYGKYLKKPVVCCLDRSADQIALYLAILKSGGVCIPIDSLEPKARLEVMCQSADCELFICDKGFQKSKVPAFCCLCDLSSLPESFFESSEDRENSPVTFNDFSFVFFTSGSSGVPKGVCVTQSSTINALRWRTRLFDIVPTDVFFYKAPVNFDISLWEIFLPLINGASLIIAKPFMHMHLPYLIDTLVDKKITVVQFVGSLLQKFIAAMSSVKYACSIRVLACGGESWNEHLAELVLATFPGLRLFNVYGQTETSLGVIATECKPGCLQKGLPVDQICSNTFLAFFDVNGNPVNEVYQAGELYVGGDPVTPGYIGIEADNRECFCNFTIDGEKSTFYKTGDYFRLLPARKFLFSGRVDNQVKVNGVRVQLEEIEAAVNDIPGVLNSAALLDDSDGKLLSILVIKSSESLSERDIKEEMHERIPSFMSPQSIHFVTELPLTANGKLDRKRLHFIKK